MWSRSEIKARGKAAFKANYWKSVLVAFLLSLFVGSTSGASASNQESNQSLQEAIAALDPMAIYIFIGLLGTVLVISVLLKIFLFNPLEVGCYRFFRKNVVDSSTGLETIKEGFSDYGHTFVTLLLRDIFLILWTCLLIVPGIIKSYSYRMVPYILKDNPELSATEVITKSREMMNGNKWKVFVLDLSFLGWIILGAITCGIVWIFWTSPYMKNTEAALYQELSENQTFSL